MNVNELRSMIKPVDETKPYVFVSYSKQDDEKVYQLIIELQKRGVNLWIDTNELKGTAGTSWQEKAFTAMRSRNCKKILFFMSKNSFFSIPVLAELTFSMNKFTKRNHNSKELGIVPISVMNDKINMSEIIASCEEEERYGSVIGEKGCNIFLSALDNEKKDEIDDKVDYGGLIGYVYEVVFDADSEITVVSGVDDIIGNIPDEAKNIPVQTIEDVKVDIKNKKEEEKIDFEKPLNESIDEIKKDKISSSYFETHKNDKDLLDRESKTQKFYDEFYQKFSPEKLKELSGLTLLRSIFLNGEGNQTNICSLLEYNKDYIQFGSIKGGVSLKHVLYYSAKEKSWMTGKPPVTYNKITEQEAIELGTKIRDNIVKACEIIDKYKDKLNTEEAYEQMYNEIDKQANGIHKVLFVKKYFHMIFKDLFPCMYSTGYIRRVADIFGYEKYLDDTKYIAKFEMVKNEHKISSNYLFGLIVYKFLNETVGNSRSEAKILNS